MIKKTAFISVLLLAFFGTVSIANAGFFASEYISAYNANVHANSDGSINIEFAIYAPRTVNQLGSQTIVLQERATASSSWTAVQTFSSTNYPEMLKNNSMNHSCSLYFDNTTSGYYYRAKVYFYSEKGGYDTREYITSSTKAK